eukprot:TRINITY_DN64247_c0_g1_i1.p2 TRINITY_DN64247_c0_g1~~TRINITY_DN64247_c0_g1_i1.p2  ORF type:complete len:322 (+),score=109.76 TRINITY_DN64247_c0_g1_i1:97-1062(+)
MGAPHQSPPISRNLTSTFCRFRFDRRGGRGGGGGLLIGGPSAEAREIQVSEQRPLRGDDPRRPHDHDIEMSSVPPAWMECAQEARMDIKAIQDKLKELAKAQNRRLLRVFGDDAAPDKEVEAISSQISSLVRRCEQSIHQVKTRGGSSASSGDKEFRMNMQRGLATRLQQCSQDFRSSQKEYMAKIKERQGGSFLDDGFGGSSASTTAGVDLGFDDSQLLELESMETNATQRSAEINQIASSISDLHTIFKELAVLVIDQGSILDRIDYNIEQVVDQSREANVQLQKAESSQKSNRSMKCMLLLVVANAILLLILIVKSRS